MSFDAGTEASVDCDGCGKYVHDGARVYCQPCAQKGIVENDGDHGRRATMALVSNDGRKLQEWIDAEVLSLTGTELAFLSDVVESMNTGRPYALVSRDRRPRYRWRRSA